MNKYYYLRFKEKRWLFVFPIALMRVDVNTVVFLFNVSLLNNSEISRQFFFLNILFGGKALIGEQFSWNYTSCGLPSFISGGFWSLIWMRRNRSRKRSDGKRDRRSWRDPRKVAVNNRLSLRYFKRWGSWSPGVKKVFQGAPATRRRAVCAGPIALIGSEKNESDR